MQTYESNLITILLNKWAAIIWISSFIDLYIISLIAYFVKCFFQVTLVRIEDDSFFRIILSHHF